MRMVGVVVVSLIALSFLIEVESSSRRSAGRSAGQARRGILGPRGRRKTIWSYNPGHRSLAFLVAGEVEVASPPPLGHRCLGCCGDRETLPVTVTPRTEPSNRLGQIAVRPDTLGAIGAEPNSVIDLCLGCCENSLTPNPTPTPKRTTVPAGGATTKVGRDMKVTAVVRKRPLQPQRAAAREKPCAPPHCNPKWRYEASSSSEEVPVVRRPAPRSRTQLQQSRMGSRCRHLGCRSPLGSIADDSDSSSSEEKD